MDTNDTLRTIAVIGAGTMGAGIAQVFAQAGYGVSLVEATADALTRGSAAIDRSLAKFVEKGTLTADERQAARDRIAMTTSLDDVERADYVIEAIGENRDAKRALFTRLDAVARPGVILATNTSSISIADIASATQRPARVLGMHFMNPVPLMPLVELVRNTRTAPDAIRVASELCAKVGKVAIEAADAPGFIANRILMPMINEAAFALMEGVGTREAIDEVMRLGMRHPMGPLALADLIGLDVCLAILEVLETGLQDRKYRACPLLRQLVADGHLGRKSGRGFYTYMAAR